MWCRYNLVFLFLYIGLRLDGRGENTVSVTLCERYSEIRSSPAGGEGEAGAADVCAGEPWLWLEASPVLASSSLWAGVPGGDALLLSASL